MKNESGKSIVILLIMTILIMIGVTVIINYAKNMFEETKLQDLITNMLLIQAETKKGLEEVCFHTVNIDETKEENKTKINEIKQEYLDGTLLSNSPEEVQENAKNIPDLEIDESCYYLDEATLIEVGIKETDANKYGYYIVKYDFENAGVEVINTKGYNSIYTLTKLNQLIHESSNEEVETNIEGEPIS